MANQMQLPQSNIEDEIKLSIQSFRRRRRVPGSGSSGISETHWVSVEFVIKGEPSQPVGTEGFIGFREDWQGSEGPARRMLGEGQTGLRRGEAGAVSHSAFASGGKLQSRAETQR